MNLVNAIRKWWGTLPSEFTEIDDLIQSMSDNEFFRIKSHGWDGEEFSHHSIYIGNEYIGTIWEEDYK